MAEIQFGLMMRAQFPRGDDMPKRFGELVEQARLANKLGYASITKGMHYSAAPWQDLQQLPFLSRIMAEAPTMRLNFGLVLLSLHKPLDIAEQIATVDVMSGGRVILGVALGYRDVEYLAFGTTQKERVRRFEENLDAIKRLWTEDAVDMVGSHFTLAGASVGTKPIQKPHPPIWIGANADPAIRRAARLGDCLFDLFQIVECAVAVSERDGGNMLRRALVIGVCAAIGLLISFPERTSAQVIVPPQRANLVEVTVNANVALDSVSGLYTYRYEVRSAPSSLQEVSDFYLAFSGSVQTLTSPPGWTALIFKDRPVILWAATEVGDIPDSEPDDGNVPPSPFQIKPGQTLTGFSFQSPDPPATNRYFVQGFTKLPQVTNDIEELPQAGAEITDFTLNSVSGNTVAPKPLDPSAMFSGGRRPAVDTFLVFLNIATCDIRRAPVAVAIKFAPNGEQVDRATFRATLNGQDVSAAFKPSPSPADLVAVFDLGTSPLQVGRNVLLTTVAGGRTRNHPNRRRRRPDHV